jgi:hypothetical protein
MIRMFESFVKPRHAVTTPHHTTPHTTARVLRDEKLEQREGVYTAHRKGRWVAVC